MITFKQVPVGKLHEDGTVSGVVPATPEPNIGVPVDSFHQEITALVQRGVKPEKILQAVESHPDITDKPIARQMAEATIGILK